MAIERLTLSINERLQRSLYEVVRDELDQELVKYALIDSMRNFQEKNKPYPFVEKRELKPKARIPEREFKYQNSFLVLLYEGTLPNEYKKYIRFFDSNRVTKENLSSHLNFTIYDNFQANYKYFENPQFTNLLHSLLPVDYALLLQRDSSAKSKSRYMLSHFHVKIDWPISNAAEDLGKELRYLTKDIYERGEKHAEFLQQKIFEYYGFHHSAGGRRTAAVVAAQYIRKLDFLFTIYVASSSSRALTKIAENKVFRYLLLKLSCKEIMDVAKANRMGLSTFQKQFIIHSEKDYGVVIFLIVYEHTIHSRPPAEGKVRSLNPDYRWLTIAYQFLIPKPSIRDSRPISYSVIYYP